MKRYLLLAMTTLLSLPSLTLAATETLSVDRLVVKKGSASTQALSVLDSRELSGSSDDWNTYIEVAPDATRFVGFFDFRADSQQGWRSLTLNTNTIGEAYNAQRWFISIRDFANGRWVRLGTNQGASDWSWYPQSLQLTDSVSNYISGSGLIRIRYHSNNATDVSNIDQLSLQLEEVGGNTGSWWQPSPEDNLTWQWQINGTLDTSLDVDMYDVDLFDTSAATIAALQANGRIVTCYFSAGTYEGWREDWRTHFPFIEGENYSGDAAPFAGNMADWDERWLDIRRMDLLEGIMSARMDLAVEKGCDAVEPDNMDAYTNSDETLLDLTAQDQLDYNRWIASLAHSRGLSVGLKNDVEQVAELAADFDWALNEQCFQYQECDVYEAFTSAGKAVFGVEYSGNPANFCPQAQAMGLSWLKKRLSLNAWRIGCETIE